MTCHRPGEKLVRQEEVGKLSPLVSVTCHGGERTRDQSRPPIPEFPHIGCQDVPGCGRMLRGPSALDGAKVGRAFYLIQSGRASVIVTDFEGKELLRMLLVVVDGDDCDGEGEGDGDP